MQIRHKKNVLIVGTGFLGRRLVLYVNATCGNNTWTHNKNQFFPNSIKFDFFCDDIAEILKRFKIDVVILSAKIEFEKSIHLLGESMM